MKGERRRGASAASAGWQRRRWRRFEPDTPSADDGESGPKRPVHRTRAAGRFSAPRGKTLLLFLLDIQRHPSERAGKRDRGESAVGARYIVRGNDTTQTVLNKNIEGAQGFCPLSPSQEGARDQSSLIAGACRPREKLAPSPARPLTLTMLCFLLVLSLSTGE